MVFVTATQDPFLLERLTSEAGIEVHPAVAPTGSAEDARATSRIAVDQRASWVVVDGYHFGASFQSLLVEQGQKVLWIDDFGHAGTYTAHLVLNQNLDADERLYAQRDARTRLLLGSRFTLLRREFLHWAAIDRERPASVTDVLLLAGGGGANDLSDRVLGMLTELESERLRFHVIGHTPSEASQDPRIHRYQRLSDLSGLMADSQLAVSAAGSTAWELAFMGVPALLVSVAENQRPVAAALEHHGAAVDLGWHTELEGERLRNHLEGLIRDRDARSEMTRRGQELVDGEGADRVVAQLLQEPLRLRPVRPTDRRRIWDWANDPQVRQASFSPEPIPWADHVAWFDRQLAADAGPFWLAMNEDETAVGQIRFELASADEADVHIAVRQGQRGRGVGASLIELATQRFFQQSPVARVHAYIRPENAASLHAFRRAGYQPAEDAVIKGRTVKHYLAERKA